MGQYYYNTQVDSLGTVYRFSYFDGTLLGPFSEGRFGGINFLTEQPRNESKDKKDTCRRYKKVKLIDNLSMNTSHNHS
jgi:hypothetical protein